MNVFFKDRGWRLWVDRLRYLCLKIRMEYIPLSCRLCGGRTTSRTGYRRVFAECGRCGFIFAGDCNPKKINTGMGMRGSWTGPGGGGYREYFLAKMLIKDLCQEKLLLFGTGNTPTFAKLKEEGVDVVGCDICQEVVDYKKDIYGKESFYTPAELPLSKKYDGIIAVECFEHFLEPGYYFDLLVNRLAEGGIICGTTNFYLGGSIEDENNPGYMSGKGHVVYWSYQSMTYIAKKYELMVSVFELICPGSVLPDEKYGQLWPNKRVFFIYSPKVHKKYFDCLKKSTPILPIDKP